MSALAADEIRTWANALGKNMSVVASKIDRRQGKNRRRNRPGPEREPRECRLTILYESKKTSCQRFSKVCSLDAFMKFDSKANDDSCVPLTKNARSWRP